MSDTTLAERLETLDNGADFTDHNTYLALLYPEGTATVDEPKAETAAAAPAPEAQAPAAAPAPVESSAPAAAAENVSEDGAAGVATKDGKRVIPYAVLHDARQTAAANAARANELTQTVARLQQELEAKQAGDATRTSEAQAQAAAAQISDEELAELEADMPVVAKLVKGYRELQAKVEQAPAPAPAAAAPAVDDVQPLIDNQPLLARWQAKGGAMWAEAIQRDAELKDDPAWAAKPVAERFAEVERQLATEYGIPVPAAATPNPPTPAPAPKPTPAAAAAPITPTLSDFNGTPTAVVDPMASMAPGQMVDAARNMSVEELRRMVGIAY